MILIKHVFCFPNQEGSERAAVKRTRGFKGATQPLLSVFSASGIIHQNSRCYWTYGSLYQHVSHIHMWKNDFDTEQLEPSSRRKYNTLFCFLFYFMWLGYVSTQVTLFQNIPCFVESKKIKYFSKKHVVSWPCSVKLNCKPVNSCYIPKSTIMLCIMHTNI